MPYGQPRYIEGKSGTSTPSTLVPVPLLRNLAQVVALPATIGGTSNRTFTLNAGVTSPVYIWVGDEYVERKKTLTYSWVVGTNTIIASDGSLSTQTNGALGVWYMYIGVESDGDVVMYPSQSAPSEVEGKFQAGYLSHPGTARPNAWRYVGFMVCDATTPTFVTMTKVGFSYLIKESEKFEQATPGTSYAALGFTGAEALPTHAGVTVSGYVDNASDDSVFLAYDSNGSGAQKWTGSAAGVLQLPFDKWPLNSGDIYSKHGTGAGNVHITQIHDVV